MPVVQVLAFLAGVAIVAYTGFAALRTVVLQLAAFPMVNMGVFIVMLLVIDLLSH